MANPGDVAEYHRDGTTSRHSVSCSGRGGGGDSQQFVPGKISDACFKDFADAVCEIELGGRAPILFFLVSLRAAATRKAQSRRDIRVKCRAMDLVSLLSRPEGKTLEFKRDLSSPEGALKTIVAFANTSGGALLIGIEDGARGVKGVPDVLKEEERLANLIADNISPKLVPFHRGDRLAEDPCPGSRDLSEFQPSSSSPPPRAGRGCFRSRRLDEPACRSRSDRGNAAFQPSVVPGRAADTGIELGSHRFPSCFRVLSADPQIDSA